MSDMYSKLGDLLNDALENNEIPQKKETETNNNSETLRENDYNKSIQKENELKTEEKIKRKVQFFRKKHENPQGEVIKMHKYANNMHIPPEIFQAYSTLHIAYPSTWRVIQKQYHKMLKELHPDTKNTIQTSDTVQNSSQYTIQQLQQAFDTLKKFYKV